MAEEHAPILTEAPQQVRPIEPFRATEKQMRNIRAVETLALHDVTFEPERFFRRGDGCAFVQHSLFARSFKPGIVHFAQAVSGTEDQVNAILPAFSFPQPMRKRLLRLEAILPKS